MVPLLEREVVEFHKIRESERERQMMELSGIKAASKLFEIFNRFVSEEKGRNSKDLKPENEIGSEVSHSG